jgi:GABA(A) receptor-associated protein
MSHLFSLFTNSVSTLPKENHTSEYKKKFTFEKRKEEFLKISQKYPGRIPIILERLESSTVDYLDKQKFLIPEDTTMGQFMYIIRKRIKLNPEESLFLFVNNTVPSMFSLISTIYSQKKDEDGFLYIQYSNENTFG